MLDQTSLFSKILATKMQKHLALMDNASLDKLEPNSKRRRTSKGGGRASSPTAQEKEHERIQALVKGGELRDYQLLGAFPFAEFALSARLLLL